MAGIRVSDAEVAGLIRGTGVELDDSAEILGYARALARPPATSESLVDVAALRELFVVMLGGERSSVTPEWRTTALHREAFDASGKATGRVFPVLPHRLVPRTIESLLTWLEAELRANEQHPVLVIGTFVLCFVSISPFERANGRMARLLCNRLLRRSGYGAMPYASLEKCFEELRETHDTALIESQTKLWTDETNLAPWLEFFLEAMNRHREIVESKIELEKQVIDYPPLQRAILETVREHGNVDAAMLLQATGANRNTLKDNLRRLVLRGVLDKSGQRRGTRYRMSSGEPRVHAQD